MPKRGELFKAAIEDNDSTQALYITCLYILKHQFGYLEDEWISMSSYIGKKEGMSFGKTWGAVNSNILTIIEAPEFHIQTALLCTTQLMLLNQRDTDKQSQLHVQHLRNSVIAFFPDKALLSAQGKQTFASIIPPADHEFYAFYNRILAGFSKIIVENKYDDIRTGLEYISRKRLILPLQNIWPAPTENDAKGGDPCWLLWGMLLSIYPTNVNVATNYKLFCLNWRKSVRNERIGLLWGIPYAIDLYSDLLWTEYELSIFDRVKEATCELWNFAQNEHRKLTVKEEIKEDSEFEPPTERKSLDSFYESFVPRKVATSVAEYDMDRLVSSINNTTFENTTKVLTIGDKNQYAHGSDSLNRLNGSGGLRIKKIEKD